MSTETNEHVYVERTNDGFVMMNFDQKEDSAAQKVAIFFWMVIAGLTLAYVGFRPISFFIIVGSFFGLWRFRRAVRLIVGLLFLCAITCGIVWLFFF